MAQVLNIDQIWAEARVMLGNTRYAPPRDSRIVCPSREWFMEEFIPKLDAITAPYVVNTYDCEDFCQQAQVLMTQCVRANEEFHGAGHMLGYVELTIPPGEQLATVRDGIHATNVIRFDTGEWFLFEPQPVPLADRLTIPAVALARGITLREVRL